MDYSTSDMLILIITCFVSIIIFILIQSFILRLTCVQLYSDNTDECKIEEDINNALKDDVDGLIIGDTELNNRNEIEQKNEVDFVSTSKLDFINSLVISIFSFTISFFGFLLLIIVGMNLGQILFL